ncbi:MAG TPA: PH domain-containing protein [Pseudonocardiaceae bacterium]|jgi:membrane protein YdbS with pleckstrin-like domain
MLAPRDPDEYLLSTERRVIRLRRHWAVVLPYLFQTLFALIIAFILSYVLGGSGAYAWLVQNVLWYVALFALLRFTYYLVEWWVERIVVTDKRAMNTSGIFTTKVAMMPVSKITDMTYERSVFGRMFGYGTLVLESAGQIQALNRIEFLPRPEEVFDAISELVFGERLGSTSARVSMMKAPPKRRRSR